MFDILKECRFYCRISIENQPKQFQNSLHTNATQWFVITVVFTFNQNKSTELEYRQNIYVTLDDHLIIVNDSIAPFYRFYMNITAQQIVFASNLNAHAIFYLKK